MYLRASSLLISGTNLFMNLHKHRQNTSPCHRPTSQSAHEPCYHSLQEPLFSHHHLDWKPKKRQRNRRLLTTHLLLRCGGVRKLAARVNTTAHLATQWANSVFFTSGLRVAKY
ncbi:hypothetical protein NPIL_615071 [Nephila pilipes]|uniref:Uncharacterized protein n=1 Tax=Nephila pilipes TaxID=299642 RepID=A0A8X6QAU8_NEPPI|nr:hypothetical protein NPIL_615071 [Nephila pilipes]